MKTRGTSVHNYVFNEIIVRTKLLVVNDDFTIISGNEPVLMVR